MPVATLATIADSLNTPDSRLRVAPSAALMLDSRRRRAPRTRNKVATLERPATGTTSDTAASQKEILCGAGAHPPRLLETG